MNIFRAAVLSSAIALATFNPAVAQWAVPNHAVPTGKGAGVIGYGSAAPGTAGPLTSNGPSADPSFQLLPNAGLATMPADTAKCNPTGSTGAVQDCTASQMATTFSFPSLAANNSWVGDQYFGGRPWFDVRAAAHGCSGAFGNGSTDDRAAIQCHIDYVNTTYGGGIVFMSGGNYHVGATVNVTQGVWLEGTGIFSTKITVTADVNPIRFETLGGVCPGGNHYGGMEKIQVNGFNNAGATTPAVIIGDNCNVTIRDSILWYGQYGLINNGVDSHIEGSFIYGFFANLSSNGANWYLRDKFDQAGANPSYGYIQGTAIAGLSVAENHFTLCDFSDTFSTGIGILIQDASNVTITTISDSVIAGAVSITGAKSTMLTSMELGGNVTASAGLLGVNGSTGLSAVTVTTTGGASGNACGNTNVTYSGGCH